MNSLQVSRLSEIMGNLALLLLVSLVLPGLIGAEKISIAKTTIGLIATMGALYSSLSLLRGGEK